jgi:hypothetical protein
MDQKGLAPTCEPIFGTTRDDFCIRSFAGKVLLTMRNQVVSSLV